MPLLPIPPSCVAATTISSVTPTLVSDDGMTIGGSSLNTIVTQLCPGRQFSFVSGLFILIIVVGQNCVDNQLCVCAQLFEHAFTTD